MRREVRKIYSSGRSSYIVTLPKDWVERNGLKAGDGVLMEIGDSSIVISTGKDEKPTKKNACIDARDLEGEPLIRRIISYYLAGYDSLRIKVYNEEHRRAIALASDILIGAEVIEDLGKEIVLEIFLDDTRYRPDDIIEKMGNICVAMLSDFCTALRSLDRYVCSSLQVREEEVDRLHFLVLRQLKSVVRRCGAMDLQTTKALEYRTVVRAFERIADHIANMSESLLKLGKPIPELCDLVEDVHELLKTANVSFLKKDTELADFVLDGFGKLSEREDDFHRRFIEKSVKEALCIKSIIDSLFRIAAYSADIAEVVINMCVPD